MLPEKAFQNGPFLEKCKKIFFHLDEVQEGSAFGFSSTPSFLLVSHANSFQIALRSRPRSTSNLFIQPIYKFYIILRNFCIKEKKMNVSLGFQPFALLTLMSVIWNQLLFQWQLQLVGWLCDSGVEKAWEAGSVRCNKNIYAP